MTAVHARDRIRDRIMANLERMEAGWDEGAYVDSATDTIDGSLSSVVDAVLDMFWIEEQEDRQSRFVRDGAGQAVCLPRELRIALVEKNEGCL